MPVSHIRMDQPKRIVILGGGYGGVAAAKTLHKALRKRGGAEITLVDRNPYHTLMTELHEVAGARVHPESVQIAFRKIFGGKKVHVVTDKIRDIDFNGRILKSEDAQYGYDYLILGVGAEPEFFCIPGIRENALPLWSLEDALRIRDRVEESFRMAAKEKDRAKREELLTFVVAGAGFTGIEMAGELMDWRKRLCARHNLDRSEVRIVVVEALDSILPNLPEKLRIKAKRILERRGVELMLKSPIVEAQPGIVGIKGGASIRTRTFIWTCGVQGCEFATNLRLSKGKRGRLTVDPCLQSPDHKEVYVVGDVLWHLDDGKAVPQIVETAVQSGETAARNILADLAGKPKQEFHPKYHGFMVSLGAYTGVAHVMGLTLTWIFAIGAKHLINIVHLLGVAGVNQVWEYLKHEFLDVRDNRSFIGGHMSAKVRIYWVVILRMFLGVMWLIEGIKKVRDGWLDPKKIFIIAVKNGADVVSAATAAAADTVSKATSAAADAVSQATTAAAKTASVTDAVSAATASVADTVSKATTAATDAVSAATTAAANAVSTAVTQAVTQLPPLLSQPLGIYTWLMDNFVSKAPFFFQALIVLTEIGIGLALMGGLFTFLAAAASIGLALMFIMGAMPSREIFWYIACALVLMGGAGRGLGLDYWVMPWLQKKWNGTKLARRTYLYVDEPSK
jgi:NADH:ubiquinone reductase (H+-translocating)